jgi:putative heme-binding domain-containing protein
MEGKDTDLFSAAIAAARALPNRKDLAAPLTPPLLSVASRTDLPPTLRVAALAAIPAKEFEPPPPVFDFLISELSPNQPLTQRMSAAEAIARAKLAPDQLLSLTLVITSAGPLELDRLLAAFEQSTDDAVGAALLAALKESKSLRSGPPDSIRKRLAKFSANIQRDAESLLADLHPDAATQKARLDSTLSTLPPGDIRRGQSIFNSEKAACATCHAVGYLGGTLGPDLTKIGATRQDRDLLESILFPSASFVQSYSPVLVQTRSGDLHAGIVKTDSDDEILLLTAPDKEVRIPRNDIKSVRPSTTSVMPEGLEQQLTRQELADLLAFLKASK